MENNPILELMYKQRNGMYIHCLEVENVWHLEIILSEIYSEFILNYKPSEVLDFCTSLSIYCMDDDESEAVYNFDVEQFINNL